MRFFLTILVFLLPQVSHAAITFNEISWMGSTESVNYEWIELYNSGSDTDVTGWFITDGSNLSIEMAGVIKAGEYAVLERSGDNTVYGEAFLIYTGALVNSGVTLKLSNDEGSLVDQVAGGEDWENIGGDNVSKQTAQYTTRGWITALATPGQENNEVQEEVIETLKEELPSANKSKNVFSSGESVRLVMPNVTLKLSVDAQKIGYVNQSILFSVKPSGIGKHLMDSLKYEWNFGDGLVSLGKENQHIFKYPGTYVVTVYGGYKRQEQVSRHEITILPVAISLTMNRDGDVQVNNDSPYEINISGYRVRVDKVFVFPERSILLSNQTVTISKQKLGKTEDRLVGLYDKESLLLASVIPDQVSSYKTSSEELIYEDVSEEDFLPSTHKPVEVFSNEFKFASESESAETLLVNNEEEVSVEDSQSKASVISSESERNERWTYLALIMIISLGIFGVYASGKRSEDS